MCTDSTLIIPHSGLFYWDLHSFTTSVNCETDQISFEGVRKVLKGFT